MRSWPRLNAIVDLETCDRAGWEPVALARAFLDGGATFLQIRAKRASGALFLAVAERIVELARPPGALVVVNDRADIALMAGAGGVHVGHEDLAPRDVRAVVGDDAVVGLSTHSLDQIRRALTQPVSYVAIGPVFGTTTKATGYEAIGLDLVRDAAACARSAGVPLVAIGGITLARAREVIDAGASSVAVISDLMADHPEARTRAFLDRLGS